MESRAHATMLLSLLTIAFARVHHDETNALDASLRHLNTKLTTLLESQSEPIVPGDDEPRAHVVQGAVIAKIAHSAKHTIQAGTFDVSKGPQVENEYKPMLGRMGLDLGEPEFYDFSDVAHGGAAMISSGTFTNNGKRVVVVGFSGTKDWKDVSVDLKAVFGTPVAENLGGEGGLKFLAAQGFLTQLNHLWDGIPGTDGMRDREGMKEKFTHVLTEFGAFDEKAEDECPAVFIAGHSLGGALGTLLAIRLASTGKFSVRLVTVGAPRPIVNDANFEAVHEALFEHDPSFSFPEPACGKIVSWRVTNEGDPVPCHPLATRGFTHAGYNVLDLHAPTVFTKEDDNNFQPAAFVNINHHKSSAYLDKLLKLYTKPVSNEASQHFDDMMQIFHDKMAHAEQEAEFERVANEPAPARDRAGIMPIKHKIEKKEKIEDSDGGFDEDDPQ